MMKQNYNHNKNYGNNKKFSNNLPPKPEGPNPLSIDTHKHVFAAYSNMAQFNAYRTLCHISAQLALDPAYIVENRLEKAEAIGALTGAAPEIREKARVLFERSFPFLLPLCDYARRSRNKNKPEGEIYAEMLRNLFRLLNHYRNHTTHYYHVGTKTVKDIAKAEASLAAPLRDVLRASVFRVEENYCKHPAPADEKGGARVAEVTAFVTQLKQNMQKDVFDYRLDRKNTANNTTELSAVGKAFIIGLFLHKKYLSEFLSQIHLFYTGRRRKENTSTIERTVVLDIFAAYRMRLPRERYNLESDPRATLSLDILGELQKCPAELMDTFCDSDKERFRLPVGTAELAEGLADKSFFRRFDDRFATLALRYIDVSSMFADVRFQVSLGALRYAFYSKQCIDATEAGRTRSLQIDLNGFGRLHEIEQARLQQWRHLMHRAPDAPDAAEARLLRREFSFEPDRPDSAPYITDSRAAYVLHSSRIGMYWPEGGSVITSDGLPRITIPDGARGDALSRLKQAGEWSVRMQAPHCFLSTYELPAVLFLEHLRSRMGAEAKATVPSAESIIKTRTAASRRFFAAVQAGEVTRDNFAATLAECGLAEADVPEKLSAWFTGKEQSGAARRNALLRNRLDEMLDDTRRRLDSFERTVEKWDQKNNRRGRADFVDLRAGKLADWLAADIVAMQPAYDKGRPVRKLTGLNFQVMQKSIAVWTGIENIRAIFKQAKLIGGKGASHPFLHEIQRADGPMEFYRAYLNQKIKYLERMASGTTDLSTLSFLARGVARWQERTPEYIRELAGRYLEGSVELPRGLFMPAIEKALRALGYQYVMKQRPGRTGACNTTHLITQYYAKTLQDSPQEFYDTTRYRRNYRLFTLLDAELRTLYLSEAEMDAAAQRLRADGIEAAVKSLMQARIKRSKKVRSAQPVHDNAETRSAFEAAIRSARREYDASERAIRRFRTQDMVLFLAAKDLLGLDTLATPEAKPTVRLRYINPFDGGGNKNILNRPMRFGVSLTLSDGRSVRITQDDLKPKNYGDFYAFFNDTRLATLIDYVARERDKGTDIELDRHALDAEFAAYDSNRPEVFRLVHEVEKRIYLAFRDAFDRKDQSVYHFTENNQSYPRLNNFNNLLRLLPPNVQAHRLLTEIRNAFSHNRYTDARVVRVALTDDLGLNIARPIASSIVDRFVSTKASYIDRATKN